MSRQVTIDVRLFPGLFEKEEILMRLVENGSCRSRGARSGSAMTPWRWALTMRRRFVRWLRSHGYTARLTLT